MEEELQPEVNTNIQTETEIDNKTIGESNLSSLPRLEDLLQSEKEVKIKQGIEGLEQVQSTFQTENKEFSKKKDNKKAHLKTRLKVVTGVYIAITALLLTCVGVNAATLAVLSRTYNSNTDTIQAKQEVVQQLSQGEIPVPEGVEITVSLNEPRDYADDNKDLTFLDKITILFRNLFG